MRSNKTIPDKNQVNLNATLDDLRAQLEAAADDRERLDAVLKYGVEKLPAVLPRMVIPRTWKETDEAWPAVVARIMAAATNEEAGAATHRGDRGTRGAPRDK